MNAPALPASAADSIAHIDLAFELKVVLDAAGRIVRANAAAGDILGYAPAELAGLPVRELLHPDERAALDTLTADLLAGRPCRERELRWRLSCSRSSSSCGYMPTLAFTWKRRSFSKPICTGRMRDRAERAVATGPPSTSRSARRSRPGRNRR